MKRAFSLLEIIFVLVIIALLLSVAFKNNMTFFSTSVKTKIKSDIALIRSVIASKSHKRLLKAQTPYPLVLDEASINSEGSLLFAGTKQSQLLEYPLVATSSFEQRKGAWSKESALGYRVWIEHENSLLFTYDRTKGTFECDYNNALCKELN